MHRTNHGSSLQLQRLSLTWQHAHFGVLFQGTGDFRRWWNAHLSRFFSVFVGFFRTSIVGQQQQVGSLASRQQCLLSCCFCSQCRRMRTTGSRRRRAVRLPPRLSPRVDARLLPHLTAGAGDSQTRAHHSAICRDDSSGDSATRPRSARRRCDVIYVARLLLHFC